MTERTPHRLLSVDGGGVRGVVALEVLGRLELLLREAQGDHDLVLGDWFDYVAGTSTGAIIAAGLAVGMPVERIRRLYHDEAHEIFRPASLLRRWSYRYDDDGLADLLRRELGEATTLGSPALRCLLLVTLRNATTGSPWPVSSNPAARFNDGPGSNLDLPLWQLVRASAAAPTYFPSERILVDGEEHVFTDGAVTTLNNPALQLFLMSTLPQYRLGWPTGAGHLLLVSVGTGTTPGPPSSGRDPSLLDSARSVPESVVHSTTVQQDMLCRVLGDCRYGPPIDAEVGDLVGGPRLLPPSFAYVRYDAELDARGLHSLGLADLDPERLRRLDDVERLEDLARVGRAVASSVDLAHLAGFVRWDGKVAGRAVPPSDVRH